MVPLIPRAWQGHEAREKQTPWVFEGACMRRVMDNFGSGNTLRLDTVKVCPGNL